MDIVVPTPPVSPTPPVTSAGQPEDDNIPPRLTQLSAAQKASRKVGQAAADAKGKLLVEDINQFLRERDEKIESLASKHHWTVAYIKKRVDNSTHYTKTRAPNLANAIAHFKAIEVNEGTYLETSHGNNINVSLDSQIFRRVKGGS